jgi:hypothetical protein
MKKMQLPPLPGYEAGDRDPRIPIAATEAEWEEIVTAAAAAGIPRARWIREAALVVAREAARRTGVDSAEHEALLRAAAGWARAALIREALERHPLYVDALQAVRGLSADCPRDVSAVSKTERGT